MSYCSWCETCIDAKDLRLPPLLLLTPTGFPTTLPAGEEVRHPDTTDGFAEHERHMENLDVAFIPTAGEDVIYNVWLA